MIKAAVMIDDWKLNIFKVHLDKAGYSFTKNPGLTPNTLNLTVMTNSVLELKPVIAEANEAARKQGKPK